MDDDVIDVSHLTDAEYKEHMKKVERESECPCLYCSSICDRITSRSECSAYQNWAAAHILNRRRR